MFVLPFELGRFLYYAVRRGFTPGVYESWLECEPLVCSYAGAMYHGFNDLGEAKRYVRGEPEVLFKIFCRSYASVHFQWPYYFVFIRPL